MLGEKMIGKFHAVEGMGYLHSGRIDIRHKNSTHHLPDGSAIDLTEYGRLYHVH